VCGFAFDLQRAKLYQQVADQIQALIVQESLSEGEKLPGERELAEGLGVCRTVVREAIRALEVRGLVLVKPGCGTYVRAFGADDAASPVALYLRLRGKAACEEAIAVVRGQVPEMLAAAAAHRTDDHRDALKDSLVSVGAGGLVTADGLNGFWFSLVAASGNGLYRATLLPALRVLHEAMEEGAAEVADWLNRCAAILTPVRDRDAIRARDAGRAYVVALTEELALTPAS
jgi:GntR family transcriptional regulator, transcriptional repressor for pyruvate dehydrogenase complex